MQWQDQAIILGVKRHGETSVIAEVMTRDRGRHLGLVRSGRSRAMQPVLQAGNAVEVIWRARLDEHLGEFRVEPVTLRAARLMETATAVYGVQAMGALLRLLPGVTRIRTSSMRWRSSSITCTTRLMPANSSYASSLLC